MRSRKHEVDAFMIEMRDIVGQMGTMKMSFGAFWGLWSDWKHLQSPVADRWA